MKIVFVTVIFLFAKPAFPQISISAAFSGTGIPQQDYIRDFTTTGDVVSPGYTNLFTSAAVTGHEGTAAIGASFSAGYTSPQLFYYMPYKYNNEGVFNLWVYNRTNSIHQEVLSGYDVNGSSGNNLTFVRLAMDKDGNAWIVAGDLVLNKVYLISVAVNGTTVLSSANVTIVDNDVTLAGGLASEFLSGDICVNYDGYIYTLANDNSGKTFLYGGYPNGSSTVFVRRFEIKDDMGNAFDGKVTGIALNEQGALYISVNNSNELPLTKSGLYYVGCNKVNNAAGTISAELKWEGTGINDLSSNQFPLVTVLAVTWHSFTAIKSANTAKLNWQVGNEDGLKEYIVERMTSESAGFIPVSKVTARNTSGLQQYALTDDLTSVTQTKVYYRIAAIDLDGQRRYSETKMLILSVKEGANSLLVYPNPAINAINIRIPDELRKPALYPVSVTFRDLTGRIIYYSSNYAGTNRDILSVNVSTMRAGVYIATITSGSSVFSANVVKQ